MPFYIVDMMRHPNLKVEGKYDTKRKADEARRRRETSHNILVTVQAKDAKEAKAKAPKASRLPASFFKIKTLI